MSGDDITLKPDEHASKSEAAAATMQAASGQIKDISGAGMRPEHVTSVNKHTEAGRKTLQAGNSLGKAAAAGAHGLGNTDTKNGKRFGKR